MMHAIIFLLIVVAVLLFLIGIQEIEIANLYADLEEERELSNSLAAQLAEIDYLAIDAEMDRLEVEDLIAELDEDLET